MIIRCLREKQFPDCLTILKKQSICTISDVELGSYVSGGIDSSLVFAEMAKTKKYSLAGFNGNYTDEGNYDESFFAKKAGNLLKWYF